MSGNKIEFNIKVREVSVPFSRSEWMKDEEKFELESPLVLQNPTRKSDLEC